MHNVQILSGNKLSFWYDRYFQYLDKADKHADLVYQICSHIKKQDNRTISSIRILLEHAIAGIKRLKSASDIYRNRRPNMDDIFTFLVAGLWNLHLQNITN